MSEPLAYFISFTCYGQWLHGDHRGSVDREHNTVGDEFVAPHEGLRRWRANTLTDDVYQLDEQRRQSVLAAVREVCAYRRWRLWAAHVRTQHVHVVVGAEATPEKMMNDFKAYASRALNAAGYDDRVQKRWTRHGSTRYINDEPHLRHAIDYVLFKQGAPQAVYDGRG